MSLWRQLVDLWACRYNEAIRHLLHGHRIAACWCHRIEAPLPLPHKVKDPDQVIWIRLPWFCLYTLHSACVKMEPPATPTSSANLLSCSATREFVDSETVSASIMECHLPFQRSRKNQFNFLYILSPIF